MGSIENGEYKGEIEEETEARSNSSHATLGDYIPIYIPTIEKGLLNQSQHEERLLDFLKAHPSKDWLSKTGSVARSSPFSSMHHDATSEAEPLPPPPPPDPEPRARSRRRFRVPFVRKINWRKLARSFMKWMKDPKHVALFIWLAFVIAGLILLALLMLGALDDEIPNSTRRKKWIEVVNQILNAFFMILCLYEHPKLFHHLVQLLRWNQVDREEMRKSYCKDGACRPHERAHMMFVVLLLHITCCAQYVLCGLYWGYSRTSRPDWAVDAAIGVGVIAPVVAGVYAVKSPLGREYNSEIDEESQRSTALDDSELEQSRRMVAVTDPEWVGGLFDCCDDSTVCCSSFFCTFCVFGWNVERLGFGNMYVHIFTFMLLCIAPLLVFSASALSIDDDNIRYVVGIVGIVLGVFGLLYGGYWRIEMRKKFKLPGNPCCCGSPGLTDFMAWQFCWSCALAQEVRTANFYDIEDESFYRPAMEEEGRSALSIELQQAGRSRSCPPQIRPIDMLNSVEMANGFPITIERAHTYEKSHVMKAPIQPLIRLED